MSEKSNTGIVIDIKTNYDGAGIDKAREDMKSLGSGNNSTASVGLDASAVDAATDSVDKLSESLNRAGDTGKKLDAPVIILDKLTLTSDSLKSKLEEITSEYAEIGSEIKKWGEMGVNEAGKYRRSVEAVNAKLDAHRSKLIAARAESAQAGDIAMTQGLDKMIDRTDDLRQRTGMVNEALNKVDQTAGKGVKTLAKGATAIKAQAQGVKGLKQSWEKIQSVSAMALGAWGMAAGAIFNLYQEVTRLDRAAALQEKVIRERNATAQKEKLDMIKQLELENKQTEREAELKEAIDSSNKSYDARLKAISANLSAQQQSIEKEKELELLMIEKERAQINYDLKTGKINEWDAMSRNQALTERVAQVEERSETAKIEAAINATDDRIHALEKKQAELEIIQEKMKNAVSGMGFKDLTEMQREMRAAVSEDSRRVDLEKEKIEIGSKMSHKRKEISELEINRADTKTRKRANDEYKAMEERILEIDEEMKQSRDSLKKWVALINELASQGMINKSVDMTENLSQVAALLRKNKEQEELNHNQWKENNDLIFQEEIERDKLERQAQAEAKAQEIKKQTRDVNNKSTNVDINRGRKATAKEGYEKAKEAQKNEWESKSKNLKGRYEKSGEVIDKASSIAQQGYITTKDYQELNKLLKDQPKEVTSCISKLIKNLNDLDRNVLKSSEAGELKKEGKARAEAQLKAMKGESLSKKGQDAIANILTELSGGDLTPKRQAYIENQAKAVGNKTEEGKQLANILKELKDMMQFSARVDENEKNTSSKIDGTTEQQIAFAKSNADDQNQIIKLANEEIEKAENVSKIDLSHLMSTVDELVAQGKITGDEAKQKVDQLRTIAQDNKVSASELKALPEIIKQLQAQGGDMSKELLKIATEMQGVGQKWIEAHKLNNDAIEKAYKELIRQGKEITDLKKKGYNSK